MMHRQGGAFNPEDVDQHILDKKEMAAAAATSNGTEYWTQLVAFERSAVQDWAYGNRERLNPFTEKRFTFDAASLIAESLVHDFGKWQNEECVSMKEHLMTLDMEKTGRVPLKTFWAQPETEVYRFTESSEYLREIGALDESPGRAPAVRIVNYLAGPSNCMAQSDYVAICCLDQCAGLIRELEEVVRGPWADPSHLLRVLQNMSSPTVDAPRDISAPLVTKLQSIAEQHAGTVPLHGRLFQQWMHFAFPNECAYPAAASAETQKRFDGSALLSLEERPLHAQAIDGQQGAEGFSALQEHWRDVEILPLHASSRTSIPSFDAHSLLTIVPYAALLSVAARTALGLWRSAMEKAQGGDGPDGTAKGKLGVIV
jgi:hypothetical protein